MNMERKKEIGTRKHKIKSTKQQEISSSDKKQKHAEKWVKSKVTACVLQNLIF